MIFCEIMDDAFDLSKITDKEKEELLKAISEDSFWPFLFVMLAFCFFDWNISNIEEENDGGR